MHSCQRSFPSIVRLVLFHSLRDALGNLWRRLAIRALMMNGRADKYHLAMRYSLTAVLVSAFRLATRRVAPKGQPFGTFSPMILYYIILLHSLILLQSSILLDTSILLDSSILLYSSIRPYFSILLHSSILLHFSILLNVFYSIL